MLCAVSPDGARVAFQLDRLEQTGEDRLEITGRWYGVRGLRFVRPALTVQTTDGERNVLALLEHKPWAAEEGEDWVAAFPWQGASPDPGQTELAVAPSVIVPLEDGKAGQARGPGGARPRLRERLEESEQRATRLEKEVAWLRDERERLQSDATRVADEASRLRADLAELRREKERADAQRDAATAARDELESARDSAATDAERVRRALGKAETELETTTAARDAALAELEAAVRERAAAVHELDSWKREHEGMVAERDSALEAQRRALADRDAALGRATGFPAMSAQDLTRQPHAPRITAATDPILRAIVAGGLVVLVLVVILLLKVA